MPDDKNTQKTENKKPEELQRVALSSFDPLTSYYSANRLDRNYSEVTDGLSELLEVFSSGDKAPEKAQKVKAFLNSEDADKKVYRDVFMKCFPDAKIGFNSSKDLPTAEEVLRVAKYTYILEKDGTVSNYAEKFFSNDSVEALYKDEKLTPQDIGTIMALHMAMFFSKTPNSPIKGIEETFGDINPGTADGSEPLRVFMTVPGHTPVAIAGRDFVKAYEASATWKEGSLNNAFNRHLDEQDIYENNRQKWQADIAESQGAIERDRKLYEAAQKKYEDAIPANEKKYADWEKSYNEKYPTDEALRNEMVRAERNKLEDWIKEQDEETYNERNSELDEEAKNYVKDLEKAQNEKILIPDPPVETNIFRRIWVFFGGGHSQEYIIAERQRNYALEMAQEDEIKIKSLEEAILGIAKRKQDVAEEREQAINTKTAEIEEKIKNLPDPKTVREEEKEKQRKELVEDPKKEMEAEIEKTKAKYESCKAVLEPEIERLQKLMENAGKESDQRASDMAKIQDAYEHKDSMEKLIQKMSFHANNTAAKLLKKSENIQKAEINERMKDPAVADKILDLNVDTIAQGSITSILDIAKSKERIDKQTEGNPRIMGIYASEVLATQDPDFVEKASQKAKEYAINTGASKENAKDTARNYFNKLCDAEYKSRLNESVKAFEEVFKIRCTSGNVSLIIDQLNIKEYAEYGLKNIDKVNPNEHPMPKVTLKNYKDMAYFVMAGLKTGMILQANKGSIDISSEAKVKDVPKEDIKNESRIKALPAGPAL